MSTPSIAPTRGVRIVDASGRTESWTSPSEAKRLVDAKRAEYSRSKASIRLIAGHHANESMILSKLEYDLAVNNGRRPITRKELQGIPFVGNINGLMGVGRKRRKGKAQAA